MADNEDVATTNPSHHVQQEFCTTRAAYRQGRKLTAVKVYSVASESQHVCIYGVPKINLRTELRSMCLRYGQIKQLRVLEHAANEAFTECFHLQYERIQSARIAKKFLDGKSFYGGILHVCYAPEYELGEETKVKLEQRKYDVLKRLQGHATLMIDHKQLQNYNDPARQNHNVPPNTLCEKQSCRKRGLKRGDSTKNENHVKRVKIFLGGHEVLPRKHYKNKTNIV